MQGLNSFIPWFATNKVSPGSMPRIDDLASGTPATTVRAVGQAGELLVTEPPTPVLWQQFRIWSLWGLTYGGLIGNKGI